MTNKNCIKPRRSHGFITIFLFVIITRSRHLLILFITLIHLCGRTPKSLKKTVFYKLFLSKALSRKEVFCIFYGQKQKSDGRGM